MKPIEMSDYNRAARTYGSFVVVAGTAAFACVIQYYLTLSFLQWFAFAGLLGLPVIAATFWVYGVYFRHASAKTREAEQASRLHLATVEALEIGRASCRERV